MMMSSISLSVLLGGFPALGLFLFYGHNPTDLVMAWMGSFIVFFLILDGKNRAKSQHELSNELKKLGKAQDLFGSQLKRLEEASSNEEDGELRLQQDLIQKVSEQEARQTSQKSDDKIPVQVVQKKKQELDGTVEEEIRVQDLPREKLLSIVKGALREDRIEMLLQPIVSLPQRKPRAFECYSRLRDTDGTVIIPDHFLGLAEEEDLIRIIDNTLLLRCIQLIRKAMKKKVSVPFFCNLSLTTLRNKAFLENFLDFIEQNRNIIPTLVFELDFQDLLQSSEETLEALHYLVKQGCRFSLDHISQIEALDLKKLKELNVKYIKFDTSLLLQSLEKDSAGKLIENFKKQTDKVGIDLIVTKVETEKDLIEMLDFQFDFGQGYLFGKPRLTEKW